MQEYQVTVGGVRYPLERPLFVLATENPIEQEGTYPLPEAQLDRFMFNVVIDYPAADDERRILAETTTSADRAATHVSRPARSSRKRACSFASFRLRRTSSTTRCVSFVRRVRTTRPRRAGEGVGALGRRPSRGTGTHPRREGVRVARRPHRARADDVTTRRAAGVAASAISELSGRGGWRHAG